MICFFALTCVIIVNLATAETDEYPANFVNI